MAVLAFHNTDPGIISGLNNYRPNRFKKLLLILKQSGYAFLSLDDYLRSEDRRDKISLTFDDGLESFYNHAFPILQELGVPSAVFIPLDFIGKRDTWDYTSFISPTRHLNHEQIYDLANRGVTIGAHGLNHECLVGMGPRRLRQQLSRPKKGLEELTGRKVRYLTYPFGRFDREVETAALECGYSKGFSLTHWRKSPTGFTLPRFGAYAFDTPWSIINKSRPGLLNEVEKIKGAVMNQYSGGTIALNRIRSLFSSKG